MADRLILAGDIGGTKTILGLFSCNDSPPALIYRRIFPSAEYSGLAAMVRKFLAPGKDVDAACFGVAGPVVDGNAYLTNLGWTVNAKALADKLQVKNVSLINDLVATGYGVSSLTAQDFLILNQGSAVATANAAVIAAGTGLGECALCWDGTSYVPMPSEAGHADYAPHDEITLDLARYLRRKNSVASVEHVVSGPGLFNIYSFLRTLGEDQETTTIAERIQKEDPAEAIAEAAMDGKSNLCARAMNIFLSAYGAEAGNLALRTLALGGVYLAGGIARKIRDRMQDGLFMKAFVEKDQLSSLMAQVPVRVILNENTPLFGAVRYLLQQEAGSKASPLMSVK